MAIPTVKSLQSVYDTAPTRIRIMLEHWVSELEPEIVTYAGFPVALTANGHCPSGVAYESELYIRYDDIVMKQRRSANHDQRRSD